jgi:hypothetical protein
MIDHTLQGMPPHLFPSAALLALSLFLVGIRRVDRILDDQGIRQAMVRQRL